MTYEQSRVITTLTASHRGVAHAGVVSSIRINVPGAKAFARDHRCRRPLIKEKRSHVYTN
jgi:hypothetical protein